MTSSFLFFLKQRPKISERITVTRNQSKNKNQATFDGSFVCGVLRVSAWVILSKEWSRLDSEVVGRMTASIILDQIDLISF